MDNKLIIEIKNSKPVGLITYADSMGSLATEFKYFTSGETYGERPKSELYIEEMRKGSIIAILLILDIAFRSIEKFNTILDFIDHIKKLIDSKRNTDKTIDSKSLERLVSFLNLPAGDKEAKLIMSTVINGKQEKVIEITAEEALRIQKNCLELLGKTERKGEPVTI